MFENCEEIVSQVQRPVEPKKILWTLDSITDLETLETLKNESKLQFEVGNGESKSILEFFLGNTNDTVDSPEYLLERTFLSLQARLVKRGLGCSSSFHTEIYLGCGDGGLRRTLTEKVFYFGDAPSSGIVIVPCLYQLCEDRKKKFETFSNMKPKYAPPLGKKFSEIPARYKIGIIVTPLHCTANTIKSASSETSESSSNLNIPVESQSPKCESLSQQLGQFYSDVAENYSDIKLESRDGMVLKAHRFVLAARSKRIHELIEGNLKSNTFNGTIQFFDMDAKELMVLLRWIYTGRLADVTEKNLEDLVNAAIKFGLTELLKTLDGEIIKICTPENMLRLFQVAKENEMESEKSDIAAFIKENIG